MQLLEENLVNRAELLEQLLQGALSVPYKSITKFSIETAGTFDLDAELKIWVAGSPDPVSQKFSKGVDVYKVQTLLAKAVCGA